MNAPYEQHQFGNDIYYSGSAVLELRAERDALQEELAAKVHALNVLADEYAALHVRVGEIGVMRAERDAARREVESLRTLLHLAILCVLAGGETGR